MADGYADDRLDHGLALYLPPDRTAGEQVLRAIALAADLLPSWGAIDPGLGAAVKGAAMLGVWLFDRRKVDRVFPVLLAMKDKLNDAEKKQTEYVRKDEFKDLFEETLRRIADEPDPQRRVWLQNILLKVIDQPKDHAESRLFLRLTEELSVEAHKVLSVLNAPVTTPADQMAKKQDVLGRRSGIPASRIDEALAELVRAGVIDGEGLSRAPKGTEGFGHLLTRMGNDFLAYRNGVVSHPA